MEPTSYAEVNDLLNELLTNIKDILDEKIIGLYLEGSLVLGDFDPKTSDIDLVAILESDINDLEFENLKKMHQDFVKKHPDWNDRIEVCYISKEAINSTKLKISDLVNISPGEPFHRMKSQKEWLMNWYLTREKSKTLFGLDPKEVINPISKEEFLDCVKDHVKSWGEWVGGMKNRYAQSYAILTLCRALYSYKNADQVSKFKAADWVKNKYPQFKNVINNALLWKKSGPKDKDDSDKSEYPKTVEFVNQVRELILEDK